MRGCRITFTFIIQRLLAVVGDFPTQAEVGEFALHCMVFMSVGVRCQDVALTVVLLVGMPVQAAGLQVSLAFVACISLLTFYRGSGLLLNSISTSE